MAIFVTWSPVPGELFELAETDVDVEHTISATVGTDAYDLLPSITGYAATITPAQVVVQVSTSLAGITVSADALAGIIPIQFVDYLLDRVPGQATRWNDLPEEAEEVVGFQPSLDASRTWTVNATVTLSDSSEHHASYTFTVKNDWTAGRDRLIAEVQARG